MSDLNPPEPSAPVYQQLDGPLDPPEPPSMSEPYSSAPRRRRPLVIGAVAVATVAALGGGAFAAWWFLSGGGPQPDEALPASTLAMISVDLDPSAGQKIEAIQTLRKFPAFKDELDIQSKDDLREYIFDKALGKDCKNLDFGKDVKPWIGERAAFAVVDLDENDPVPTIALALSDSEKAKAGIQAVLDCADDEDTGFAVGADYVILSDSQRHAEKILKAGQENPLSENKAYQDMTDKVGDRGVVNFYVAKEAGAALADFVDEFGSELDQGLQKGIGDASLGAGRDAGLSVRPAAVRSAEECNPFDGLRSQLEGFGGFAGTVRFADGGVELAAVGTGGKAVGSGAGVQVGDLPGNTAIALGFTPPGDYASRSVEPLDGCGFENEIKSFEKESGLAVPEDVQTLLGKSLTLSVGENLPDLAGIEDPSEVPVGLVIHGDGPRIKDLISKLNSFAKTKLGGSLDDLGITVQADSDRVVLTPSDSYAGELKADGNLGDSQSFKDAVPEAEKAFGLLYVNFDSKARDALIQFAGDEGASSNDVKEMRENTEPLKSLGISAWRDGQDDRFLIKIATN